MTGTGMKRRITLKCKNDYMSNFILSMKSNPCLYDDEDKDFGLEEAVDNAWNDVLEKCKKHKYSEGTESVESLKAEWSKCRRSFTTERAKRKDDKRRNGGWSLYSLMLFMDKHIPTRERQAKGTSKKGVSNGGLDIKNERLDNVDDGVNLGADADSVADVNVDAEIEAAVDSIEKYDNRESSTAPSSVLNKPSTSVYTDSPVSGTLTDQSTQLLSRVGQKRTHDTVKLNIHSDEDVKKMKIIRQRELQSAKNLRLEQAKEKAEEDVRRLRDLEMAARQKENEEKMDVENKRNMNKFFASYVVSNINNVKDEELRELLLSDVMGILYMPKAELDKAIIALQNKT